LNTPRNYVTLGDSLELRVEGIQTSYTCSEITRLEIVLNDTNYLQPVVDITLPQTIDECPLVPESGLDTIIVVQLSDFDSNDTFLGLVNSSGIETNSAMLTVYPHLSVFTEYPILDSNLTDSAFIENFELYTDTLTIDCEEKFSYGGYCFNSSRDSVFLRVVNTVGWPVGTCTAGTSLDVTDPYFRSFTAASGEVCGDSLRNLQGAVTF